MSSDLRAQLEAVRARHGRLTPDVVLDDAREPGHPLHSRFEWNDSVAAERYRREQAHELIRSVRVTYRPSDGPAREVRRFLPVPRPNSRQPDYQDVDTIAADPVAAAVVLAQFEREWRALRTRFGHLTEFFAVVDRDRADPAA